MSAEVQEIRLLLASVVGREVADSLDEHELIFAQGVVDSLHLVQIIDGFQSDFGVAVAGHDLSPENFGSIGGMARYLQTKRPV
jgi:acyl carrier protein